MTRFNPAIGLAPLMIFTVVLGCDSSGSKPVGGDEKPAKVEKLPVETELATVTLSADAARRLGIETQPVVQKQVTPRRMLGGEAIIPAGKSIIVTAPVSGAVAELDDQGIPNPGVRVERNEPMLKLVPLLSPERDVPTPAEQVQLVGARASIVAAETIARGDVERSRAEVNAAKISLDRAEKLFQDRAGPRKAVDDAEAQLKIAESVFDAATRREQRLTQLLGMLEVEASEARAVALPLLAPIGGIVNRMSVSTGQTVSGGSMLFEIVNLDTLWIRVPVFVDLLSTIQSDQAAQLVSLSGGPAQLNGSGPIQVRPIPAPPTADALTASADLYYEVDNRTLGLRPGQRVGVELPLAGESNALVVPYASVLLDIHGNAWVYVISGERQYVRRRITIRWVDADDAILASGPPVGSQVVVAGAAELFGTEFGAGK